MWTYLGFSDLFFSGYGKRYNDGKMDMFQSNFIIYSTRVFIMSYCSALFLNTHNQNILIFIIIFLLLFLSITSPQANNDGFCFTKTNYV